MRTYGTVITLAKNKRGIWDFDTIKGCESGLLSTKNGCYGDCYSYKIARSKGLDFSKSINRNFINESHRAYLVNQILKIDMPFIRIGCSGDPSEDWQHTINIIAGLKKNEQLNLFGSHQKKEIVIITRHFKTLTDKQLEALVKYKIVFNTSISALDPSEMYDKSIEQYKRLKPYFKSILRVISCKFNLDNPEGFRLNEIQKKLLENDNILDTAFRPSLKNTFVQDGIITVQKAAFMKTVQFVSKNNQKVFLGKCTSCLEMCGLNL